MKLRYEAQVIDEDVYIPDENMDGVLGKISAPTMEMLEEQLGKLESAEELNKKSECCDDEIEYGQCKKCKEHAE